MLKIVLDGKDNNVTMSITKFRSLYDHCSLMQIILYECKPIALPGLQDEFSRYFAEYLPSSMQIIHSNGTVHTCSICSLHFLVIVPQHASGIHKIDQ